MDYKVFMKRLKEVEKIGRIEAGYSHIIWDLIYNDIWVDNETDYMDNETDYMLVDTSTAKRCKSNKNLFPVNICAVPDFVITNYTLDLNEITVYACIDVKYWDNDVDEHEKKENRLLEKEEVKGYLNVYKYAIFTNGWKWNCYTKEKNGWKLEWVKDFTKKSNQNVSYFNTLKDELKKITPPFKFLN